VRQGDWMTGRLGEVRKMKDERARGRAVVRKSRESRDMQYTDVAESLGGNVEPNFIRLKTSTREPGTRNRKP